MQNPPVVPFDATTALNNNNNNTTTNNDEEAANLAVWRERERRQRSVRVLMTFLLMLLLMDDETPESRNNRKSRLRARHAAAAEQGVTLEPSVFASRVHQDSVLQQIAPRHERYQQLVAKNGGTDIGTEITAYAESERDEFAQQVITQRQIIISQEEKNDPENNKKVWHYPWNATGFYRGEWKRLNNNNKNNQSSTAAIKDTVTVSQRRTPEKTSVTEEKNAVELQDELLQRLRVQNEMARVVLLSSTRIQMRNDNNLTSTQYDDVRIDGNGRPRKQLPMMSAATTNTQQSLPISGAISTEHSKQQEQITLTRNDGRAAFQLFARSIPGMREMSLLDGYLKLYDSTSPGYSTRKDVLLRLRGVLLHSIGKVSLVSVSSSSSHSDTADTTTTSDGSSTTTTTTNNGGGGSVRQCALVIDPEFGTKKATVTTNAADALHRRLELAVQNAHDDNADANKNTPQLVSDAWELYGRTAGRRRLLFTDMDETQLLDGGDDDVVTEDDDDTMDAHDYSYYNAVDEGIQAAPIASTTRNTVTKTTNTNQQEAEKANVAETATNVMVADNDGSSTKIASSNDAVPPWSDIVLPYPFVRDDKTETIRKVRTPAARMMPPREQSLEANAAACGFEVNMDIAPVEWTVGEWRKLVSRRVEELKRLNPASQQQQQQQQQSSSKPPEDKDDPRQTTTADSTASAARMVSGRRRTSSTAAVNRKPIQDQALVMNMVGTIHSENCNFTAFLNTTALRTDWDATTSKAINYSFYMMLVCLTQILILLRQLLHSQSQSTATRVSLLCIGWQTVIDALSCLAHIYLSLAVQPLFTAFASVAFFKLLIFGVIEMKYMAIIIQARNSSNGGQPLDVLRRQVTMLHLRFYVALLVTFLLMFYVGDKYRIYYMLLLYSFWVPQIVMNIITEAKTPMHKYFVYGMSITRMVTPVYVFALPNNFLKEVYPEAPTDPYMCQWLILWVACQTAILMAQSKYGARFMIPARFLPPKFDYSRPLPPSMLPPGAFDLPTPECMDEREDMLRSPTVPKPQESKKTSIGSLSSSPPSRRHKTAETTRNRHKGNRLSHQGNSMITENHTLQPQPTAAPAAAAPTLECSICYDDIDIRDRHNYMLAPCNHLFHRECLAQWMDVKMECPICRTNLPAL